MVNHSLWVATTNPLSHSLLFERFPGERRSSLPDTVLQTGEVPGTAPLSLTTRHADYGGLLVTSS